jgi:hypothetical protein
MVRYRLVVCATSFHRKGLKTGGRENRERMMRALQSYTSPDMPVLQSPSLLNLRHLRLLLVPSAMNDSLLSHRIAACCLIWRSSTNAHGSTTLHIVSHRSLSMNDGVISSTGTYSHSTSCLHCTFCATTLVNLSQS